MNPDEMIGLPDADEGASTPPAPSTPPSSTTPPASTGEVEGVLLDNDEQPAADQGSPSEDQQRAQHASGTGDSGTGSDEEEARVADEQESSQSQQIQPQETAQTTTQLADPGEFQPKDYSFDIELADGTKVHIASPEDLDNIPADADFGSPQNLMKAQANFNKMVVGIDADKREYDAKKSEFEQQQTASADLEQRVATMINEMNYLETKGRLPKIDAKYDNADWSDPEVAKQPGVAERLALLTYRAKENEERTKLGLSPMSVLEAHVQMQQDAAEKRAADTKQRQGDMRKQRGAMVTGPSVNPSTAIPDDMIIGEGGSTRDIGY